LLFWRFRSLRCWRWWRCRCWPPPSRGYAAAVLLFGSVHAISLGFA
jgi:hypothetical protein